ncbi:Uu.00g103950.m01.CDS01 [Anthostomella pinea]|uniref:Uu.00g103950.m01.CDS01 n=1 Tax=Anthostomella pinea TaxID=933095 RepID=A0AAI8VDP7_9PEZI|nr:Uu.00g103950.m01.CDS01 [Anthostomella pinea]
MAKIPLGELRSTRLINNLHKPADDTKDELTAFVYEATVVATNETVQLKIGPDEPSFANEILVYKALSDKPGETASVFKAIATNATGSTVGIVTEFIEVTEAPTISDTETCRSNLLALHRKGWAHGGLDADDFLVKDGRCWIENFRHAQKVADEDPNRGWSAAGDGIKADRNAFRRNLQPTARRDHRVSATLIDSALTRSWMC